MYVSTCIFGKALISNIFLFYGKTQVLFEIFGLLMFHECNQELQLSIVSGKYIDTLLISTKINVSGNTKSTILVH